MHVSIIKFVSVTLFSAVCAVLGIFKYAFINGKSPAEDGPRAPIAEFFGDCIGIFFLIWSFTIPNGVLQWKLRGAAALAWIIGISPSMYFANTPEVSEAPAPDQEPTGFKSKLTDLHLK